jgi:hypothetical protein
MSQYKPRTTDKEAQSSRIIGGVFKEIVHSAGVVVGGLLISVLLVSQEGRTLRHH